MTTLRPPATPARATRHDGYYTLRDVEYRVLADFQRLLQQWARPLSDVECRTHIAELVSSVPDMMRQPNVRRLEMLLADPWLLDEQAASAPVTPAQVLSEIITRHLTDFLLAAYADWDATRTNATSEDPERLAPGPARDAR